MIREITRNDRDIFLRLSEEFYKSDAVLHDIPAEFHEAAFDELMRSKEYASAYMIEREGETVGYLLTAKTYSRETGGLVLWLEEMYMRPAYRSKGLGKEAFAFIEALAARENIRRLRLEVEEDNVRARSLYERLGYRSLEYGQMVKELE